MKTLTFLFSLLFLSSSLCFAGQGWYLIEAPMSYKESTKETNTKLDAPLSAWYEISSFDTSKECEKEKRKQLRDYWNNYIKKNSIDKNRDQGEIIVSMSHNDQQDYLRVSYTRCIASDDPRLKP